MSEPKSFYGEQVPEQFNRSFEAQFARANAAEATPEDSELFESMLGLDTTIRVVVEGDANGPFYLNIDSGRMGCGESAQHPLCLTLVQDARAFEVLAREAGDSALGFLGGLAGLASDFHLTTGRVAALGEVGGCLRFTLDGDGGFSVLTHFGEGDPPGEPDATIRIKAQAYEQMRSGELSPPEAFMSGAVNIEGDMQLAMQIALALLAED